MGIRDCDARKRVHVIGTSWKRYHEVKRTGETESEHAPRPCRVHFPEGGYHLVAGSDSEHDFQKSLISLGFIRYFDVP